jgi:ribosomal protein L11 methylase PrmA
MPKPTPAPTAKPEAETVAAFDVDPLAATDTDEAKAPSNNVGSEVVDQETGEIITIITMPKTKHTVVKSQIDDLKGMF